MRPASAFFDIQLSNSRVQKNNGIIRMLSRKTPAPVSFDNNSIPYICKKRHKYFC